MRTIGCCLSLCGGGICATDFDGDIGCGLGFLKGTTLDEASETCLGVTEGGVCAATDWDGSVCAVCDRTEDCVVG